MPTQPSPQNFFTDFLKSKDCAIEGFKSTKECPSRVPISEMEDAILAFTENKIKFIDLTENTF
jgi:hypothetical protein